MSTGARDAAFVCVIAVLEEDTYANLAMPKILKDFRLSGRDAAFATELAYGALRMQGLYDAVITDCAQREASTIQPVVRAALWLGVHQVLSMRVPSHAAVNETVALVRREDGAGAAGFANAIMRRVTEHTRDEWEALLAPGDDARDLGIRHSHPTWVVEELAASLAVHGRAGDTEELLLAHNAPPLVTLAARPGLISRAELLASIPGATATPHSPYGVILPGGDPSAIAAMRDGLASVQDEGSQLVAAALAEAQPIAPGEQWLDMCAGPGGKAALLGAIAAQHGGHVDALELHPHRAELVRESVKRLPAGTVTVMVGDGRDFGRAASYDRIIVDAPCTGLGSLRRRPEARWRKNPDDVTQLAILQRELLTAAGRLVKPGGVVAYVTCSPVIAETTAIAGAVASLTPLDAPAAIARVSGRDAGEYGVGPYAQLWTHVHGTDSMFLALLRRPPVR